MVTALWAAAGILAAAAAEPAVIAVKPDTVLRPISRYLNGLCVNMARDTDERWRDGNVAKLLRTAGITWLRYPDTTHAGYHWKECPGAPVWKDAWERDPASPFFFADHSVCRSEGVMGVDDFFAACRSLGAEPFMDLNIQSGLRYGRLDDSLAESLELMRYCRDKGYAVRWWRLGNEPFQYSPEALAEIINRWVPEMKKNSPGIRVVFNASNHYSSRGSRARWARIFELAGRHIDIADMHHYWRWADPAKQSDQGPTWERFLTENPPRNDQREKTTSVAEFSALREMVKTRFGRDVDLASTEWNCGPVRGYPMSAFQFALIRAELTMQFIEAGLTMAASWPGNWPDPRRRNRATLLDPVTLEPLPVYHVARMYSHALGLEQAACESRTEGLPAVAAVDAARRTVRVYVVNKSSAAREARIAVGRRVARAQAVALVAGPGGAASDESASVNLDAAAADRSITLRLPEFSFTMAEIRLSR